VKDEPATGGRDRRTYFPALKTTIPGKLAEQIIADRRLHGITGPCTLECCRFRPATDLPARRRQYLLWSRQHELKSLNGSTPDVRLHQVHQALLAARSTGDRLRRACIDAEIDPPKLEHLDCWLSVIARSREIQAAA